MNDGPLMENFWLFGQENYLLKLQHPLRMQLTYERT